MSENTNNKKTTEEVVQVTAYSVLIAFLCMMTFGVSFVSRNVWSSTIASESALEALGITLVQAGGIASAFYIGYVVSNFFSGFFVDKLGPRITLAATALGTGLFTVLIPLVSGYWAIFALRVLAGVAAGPLFAGISKMNYGWFPDRVRATVVGFMMSGPAVGMAFASIVFTPMVATRGYKTAFVYAGILTIIVGVIVLIFMKEKGLSRGSRGVEKSTEEKAAEVKNAIKVFTTKDFMINTVMHTILVGAGQGLQTWILAYLIIGKEMTPAVAGMIFGSASLVSLVTNILSGTVSDILKTRKWIVIIASVVTFIFMYMYRASTSVTALTAVTILMTIARGFQGTASNAMQTERAKGPNAGKVMGWYNAVCQLGSIIYPIITGAVLAATQNYFAVIMILAGSFLAVGVLGLFIDDTYVSRPKEIKKTA
ncbi:MFS transporter [Alkalibacter rhizosphaerae]|uniref:MFS transporter n=1 Tax=Alkalibacter rhizosphaerae TaxID=2815577 RepID=A0A974XG75_9FIRM|nr:MFS transporter [Alkalibacter rhizosphaerae]QSX08145.1 MFS transporter [Alkalibacter rhizosphaerae]